MRQACEVNVTVLTSMRFCAPHSTYAHAPKLHCHWFIHSEVDVLLLTW